VVLSQARPEIIAFGSSDDREILRRLRAAQDDESGRWRAVAFPKDDRSFQLREGTCHRRRRCSPKDRDQRRPLNLGPLPRLNHGAANDDEAATLGT
jgi:hypothetical protein